MTSATDARRLLLDLYAAALARVDGRRAVHQFLQSRSFAGKLQLIAIGKAAAAMALGACDTLGEQVERALVITRHGYGDPHLPARAQLIEAGHPTPDAASLAAGRALLEFVAAAPADARFLFLLSGGSSALVEVLPPGMTLDDLARANQWLLGAGLDIGAMNAVRKRLSCIKQGRLAPCLGGRPALVLIISDVPGDDPAIIGSGPLTADPSGDQSLPAGLPEWLHDLATRAPTAPTVGDPIFQSIESHVIARNADAREAVIVAARARGLPVHAADALLAGDAREAGRDIVRRVRAGAPGLYVWGGETRVTLPATPGRGGRCQSLALEAALAVDGDERLFLLAAGTDGSDGPGEDAGALVDGMTVARGEAEGFSAREALVRADAGSFLEASGDLIATGPTGTNVMDLVLALKRAPQDTMAP